MRSVAVEFANMPRPPPVVTGISPKEGKPGTRVVIRGENFGATQRDLIGKDRAISLKSSLYKELVRFFADFSRIYVNSWLFIIMVFLKCCPPRLDSVDVLSFFYVCMVIINQSVILWSDFSRFS